MSADWETELKSVFEGVRILSPTSFMCREAEIQCSPEEFVSNLQQVLYVRCYTRKLSDNTPRPAGERTDMSGNLRRVHGGSACRDSGWTIERVIDGSAVVARKGSGLRLFTPGQYLLLRGPSASLEKGQQLLICQPKDSTTHQPGYYHAWGETLGDYSDHSNLVRFYWNTDPDGAVTLIDLVTRRFNRFQVPFQVKCPSFRELYDRCDAVVLYVSKWHYRIAAQLVEEFYEIVQSRLKDETPLFTKKLNAGLGFAEDPDNTESFGTDRCGILAKALIEASRQGLATEEAKLNTLRAAFEARGLSLARPYLNAGSNDEYEYPVAS